jgi:hypothetical protein
LLDAAWLASLGSCSFKPTFSRKSLALPGANLKPVRPSSTSSLKAPTLEAITEVCTGFDDRAVEGLIASRRRYEKLGGLDQPEDLLRRPSADEFDPRFWSDVPQAYLGAIAD